MKHYILKKIDYEDYNYFIISLTYESILNYIEEIENELKQKKYTGLVLIDQLLITGNNKNRFISCNFKKGKVELSTAKNVNCEEKIRKITSQALKEKEYILQYSILSNSQKQKILEGRAL